MVLRTVLARGAARIGRREQRAMTGHYANAISGIIVVSLLVAGAAGVVRLMEPKYEVDYRYEVLKRDARGLRLAAGGGAKQSRIGMGASGRCELGPYAVRVTS